MIVVLFILLIIVGSVFI
ncbi:hypothetical protein DCE79_03290 [Lysinibacillus sp. 2017]|nr:hypothetical protein DCE79_03290 [Lysinibacillus sp. 2017]TGN31211.1 YjcZ family sporulation protein [Lysinibacillus sp. S2017]